MSSKYHNRCMHLHNAPTHTHTIVHFTTKCNLFCYYEVTPCQRRRRYIPQLTQQNRTLFKVIQQDMQLCLGCRKWLTYMENIFPPFSPITVLCMQNIWWQGLEHRTSLIHYHITWGISQHWVKRHTWSIIGFLTMKPRSLWTDLKYHIFCSTGTIICIKRASFMKIHDT